MALTTFQRHVCRLLADRRRGEGESYVAGGVALSVALETHRLSRDLDLFHDTTEAVARAWDLDRARLVEAGCRIEVLRERSGFVEARVTRAADSLLIEWARETAFRFFPLVEHDELGLTLHPFDLATNKVLALVGRLEVRDWIDVLACDARLQPLGLLAWRPVARTRDSPRLACWPRLAARPAIPTQKSRPSRSRVRHRAQPISRANGTSRSKRPTRSSRGCPRRSPDRLC